MSRRPLRIARVISDLRVGGVQNMLNGTLPLFDHDRHEVRVACTYKLGDIARRLVDAGVPCDLVPVKGRMNPLGVRRLATWMREHRLDVVHTHMYASNITGLLAARLAGVPVVVAHVHATHEWKTPMRGRVDGALARWRDMTLTVSGAVRDAYFDATGLAPSDRVRVLPNAPRTLRRNPVGGAALRRELCIEATAPVFGTIARLVPVKAIDMMIRGIAPVLRQDARARLVIVGPGPDRAALEALAASLGVGAQVLFMGQRIDVEIFFELFDVFLLTSRTEGCPNVVMEAMTFGKPIIATRVGGVPELVTHEVTGLLVPDQDHAALTSQALRILSEPQLRAKVSEGASAFISGFSRTAYVQKLGVLYDELTERKLSHA